MNATERLRALLDERGVEYRWDNGTATWRVDGVMYNAWGYDNERLTMSVCHLTPEQAIAATLGSCNCSNNCTNSERTETCHDSNSRFNAWQCSECGATMLLMFDDYDEPTFSVDGVADVPHFCPNCGRKVVDE